MFTTSKCTDLAPIARLPQGNPIEAIGDYFQSLMENNLVRKPPVWDSAGREGGLETERIRQEGRDTEERLERARKWQVGERRKMDDKWAALEDRQLMLRTSFMKFNKFVCENQEKRKRSIQKLLEDKEAYYNKEAMMEAIEKDVEDLTAVCANMEEYIEKHAMYEKFLKEVVESNNQFRTPPEILTRYEALSMAKKVLAQRQERDLADLETVSRDMLRLIDTKKLHFMGLNNNLEKLRLRYDEAKNDSRKWEFVLNLVRETTATKQVELCRVKESLWSMYKMICKDKGVPVTADKHNYEDQLVMVMRAISEAKKIAQIAKKKEAMKMDSRNHDTYKR